MQIYYASTTCLQEMLIYKLKKRGCEKTRLSFFTSSSIFCVSCA
ncbi:Hypothetical protein EUBREC_2409 [Agathobacter rectalis ATCC 33656]|uniref:Uncharacterized protein n=1 Tax=Agathobacter rectalis (strain ATCC 33656 / DSM 3377 / JCM 17463 / KCTC 5835 / VPI 0990) TaxID=515619 RepID=C4ZF19_AGARV|nr:Hypothetical protein EUBREC_2409 [Agathobacter rectalis ATCC 33656]